MILKYQLNRNNKNPKNQLFQCAVILAGGDSNRMGFDKQQLFFNGNRLIFNIIEQLEEIFPRIVVVTNKPEVYSKSQVITIADIYQNRGPLGGVHAALSTGLSEYYYLIACDMPILNNTFIAYLQKLVLKIKPDILCALNGRGWIEPFNAFYSARCLDALNTYIKKKKTALFKFIKTQNTYYLGLDEVKKFSPSFEMFKDINTLQDLTKYKLLEKPSFKNKGKLPVGY